VTTVHPAFEFQNITKTFGSVTANNNVSFRVDEHTIHAVVGENGAGKSTIMNILYGLYQPDSGDILVHGKKRVMTSPHEAIGLGIGMVHQHFMLVPTLTVWQNIILGKEPEVFHLNPNKITSKLDALQKTFGFSLDLFARIEDLPVGHQQQVEILKLLFRKANTLILDEPTAVLTPQEVEVLFAQLRRLWKENKTIILITHKLKEVMELTEKVTIMRQGKVIDTVVTSSLTQVSLAEMIVGRKLATLPAKEPPHHPTPVVAVTNLTLVKDGVKRVLNDLSFHIKSGEILGIAGVEGNGQQELIDILANVNQTYEGEVLFEGVPLTSASTYEVKQKGLAVIPPDRHQQGLILNFSLMENLMLGHHREERFLRSICISKHKLQRHANALIEKFDVRPPQSDLPASAFSGGNQQKIVIARELSGKVKFIIAAHPTRGVDIGAIEFIHSLFLQYRKEGAAILLVSSELEEILALSDRINVIYEGRFVGEVPACEATESDLGLWMTCGKAADASL